MNDEGEGKAAGCGARGTHTRRTSQEGYVVRRKSVNEESKTKHIEVKVYSRVPTKLDQRVLHEDPPEGVTHRMGLVEDLEGGR